MKGQDMYKLSTIKKALKLLKKYDYSYCKVSRELGINARTLRCWHKKEINNEPLVCLTHNKKSRWSDEYKKEVTDYYFNHGENIMFLYRKFGQPSYDLMKIWIRLDKRYKKKHKYRKPIKRYVEEEKKEIVVQSALREDSLAEFASNYNLNRATINLWKKEFMAEPITNTTKMTKQELINNIKDLRKEHIKLEMENKILKKANELIKKDLGANFNNLTNRDKTIIISVLTPEYKVNNLLKAIKLAKSTYYYELKAILRNK